MAKQQNHSSSLLLFSLAVYIAAYFALVSIVPRSSFTGRPPYLHKVEYRLGGAMSKAIFAPVNAIDRRLRYDTWRYTREEFERLLRDSQESQRRKSKTRSIGDS